LLVIELQSVSDIEDRFGDLTRLRPGTYAATQLRTLPLRPMVAPTGVFHGTQLRPRDWIFALGSVSSWGHCV